MQYSGDWFNKNIRFDILKVTIFDNFQFDLYKHKAWNWIIQMEF